ncbi:MAG: hypothetical protein KAQ63_02705 [Candidatus Moranbacteria bacterium]|nr:hypothetical protein [Candidatus Moranbacteria bacterium]
MKRFLIISALVVGTALFSGCTVNSPDGGFFKSVNGGLKFDQNISEEGLVLIGKNILALEINPSNDKEIFVGTLGSGLFKTVDEGQTWLSDVNNFQSIYDIELIPNSQVIYMTAKKDGRGKLFKSDNNGEAWKEVYTEEAGGSFLTSIAVHSSNLGAIYIANSKGGLFKSEDGGVTWRNLYWAKNLIRKIEIDKVNPNIIYLATSTNGLLRSQNQGNDFEPIISGGYIYNVIAHPNREGFVYASSKKGLQRSSNQGSDWETLNTLVKSEELVSRGLAINSNNTREIYYSSGKAFYKSTNEGETWMPVQFNIGAAIEIIKINPKNDQVIYVGTNRRNSGLNLTPGFN